MSFFQFCSNFSFSELLVIRSRPTVACPVTRNYSSTAKVNQKAVWDQGVARWYCGLLIFVNNYEYMCVLNTSLRRYHFFLCLLSYNILWVFVDSLERKELNFRARNMSVLSMNSAQVPKDTAGFLLQVYVVYNNLKAQRLMYVLSDLTFRYSAFRQQIHLWVSYKRFEFTAYLMQIKKSGYVTSLSSVKGLQMHC